MSAWQTMNERCRPAPLRIRARTWCCYTQSMLHPVCLQVYGVRRCITSGCMYRMIDVLIQNHTHSFLEKDFVEARNIMRNQRQTTLRTNARLRKDPKNVNPSRALRSLVNLEGVTRTYPRNTEKFLSLTSCFSYWSGNGRRGR